MSDTIKVLAQNSPSANTDTTFYTVPASTSTVSGTLTVCNTNTTDVKVRVWIAVAGANTATSQYILYNTLVVGEQTTVFSAGLTMAATDVVKIRADTANVAFSLFGVEVT